MAPALHPASAGGPSRNPIDWDGIAYGPGYDWKTFTSGNFPIGLYVRDGGTEVYVVHDNDEVTHNTLSSAWVPSTASETASESLTTGQGIWFKPDGTKMYMTHAGVVKEYDLSTAWDITTQSLNQSITYDSGVTWDPIIRFNDAGTVCFIMYLDGSSGFAKQFTLSTAWDISTLSAAAGKSYDFGQDVFSVHSIWVGGFVTKWTFWAGFSYAHNDKILQYQMSRPYDPSSITATEEVELDYNLATNAYFGDPEGDDVIATRPGAGHGFILLFTK